MTHLYHDYHDCHDHHNFISVIISFIILDIDIIILIIAGINHHALYEESSYSIGLYSLKFIKPYEQSEPHLEEKCGWRKVMVEMENVPPNCKGKYYGGK